MSQASPLSVSLDMLFVGSVGVLANDGGASAMDKHAVDDSRHVDTHRLADDAVADPHHHGGPERVLNHYPAEHYEHWRSRYPGFEDVFKPGVLGENLSTSGMTEADVCVGDVFTLGTAIIQISQPRQPCWKIGVRTGIAGLAKAVIQHGRAGWLYRVTEPGDIRAGDTLTRIESAAHGINLARMWDIHTKREPSEDERLAMITLAELPSLAPEWRKRMASRARQIAERRRTR